MRPAIDECHIKFGEKGMGRSALLNAYAVSTEAAQTGARLNAIKTKYDVH